MARSWEDRDEILGLGALHANGDALFSDPLNVRKGSQRSPPVAPQPPARSPYRGGQDLRDDELPQEVEHEDPKREEEEESWNPVTSFVMWMVAGGKDCCSQRDRTKPAQSVKSQFPEPRQAYSHGQDVGSRSRAPAPVQRGADSDSEESIRGTSRRGPQGRAESPRHSSAAAERRSQQATPMPASAPAPVLGSPAQNRAPSAASLHAAGTAPAIGRWEWPSWCLDFKNPSIDVWVLDDETGQGKWCQAEPQSRVVDKSGRDAYLCAEYMWDGDYYAQDFGPQHVRRRGSRETVFDMFQKAQGGGYNDLDQTRVAPGRGGR